ncbi:hypothetical protein C8R47DRAFT_980909 [Mycena vitilis]|nr:hypothetical protein C8R47DRAFT_980909 [Mycena vitilis]
MYFAGCFALLFFDFFLTLVDEVQCVWKGKKSSKPILPNGLQCDHIIRCRRITRSIPASIRFSFMDLRSPSCNRFAIVEWLQTLLIVIPAEVVLLLRVSALTNRNKYLFGLLVSIIVAECVVVFYAMSLPGTNNALVLPHIPIDSFHVCILFSDPRMDTAYLSISIAFDCIVFAVTIACTVNNHSYRSPSSILQTIRWDGTLYFCVILSGNVVWMALAINARPGLKLMNAQYVFPFLPSLCSPTQSPSADPACSESHAFTAEPSSPLCPCS